MTARRPVGVGVLLTVATATLSACSGGGSSTPPADSPSAAGAVTVVSTDGECRLSSDSAAAGDIPFSIRNDGSGVTEFYLYQSDGVTVAGEVEDIAPGTTRELSVSAGPGSYVATCKPGMVGDGIKVPFTVT